MNKNIPQKEKMVELYSRGFSMREIGKELGYSTGKIYKYFKIYNIKVREPGSKSKIAREKISVKSKGKKYALGAKRTKEQRERQSILLSKGIGKKTIHNGYVRIYFPDHPKSDKRGFILEHILIMECNIGRWLKDNEVVHHKNKIRSDNRIENLQLLTRAEHTRLHRKEKIKEMMTYQ